VIFAAATQGYFIAKSKRWESAALLFIAFMLFRPDFFLDQVSEKYTTVQGPAAMQTIGEQEDGKLVRLTVSGPDFDTGDNRRTTVTMTYDGTDAETALANSGLTVFAEDDKLLLEEPFPGSPFFGSIGTEYDYYGDAPVVIAQVEVENERLPKELFFIPALLLLAGLVMIQRPRATQPAF
jgi:hypothetical protein